MGDISENYIHDHDGNVSVVPIPAPVAVNPKVYDNFAASIIDTVVV